MPDSERCYCIEFNENNSAAWSALTKVLFINKALFSFITFTEFDVHANEPNLTLLILTISKYKIIYAHMQMSRIVYVTTSPIF